MAWLKFHCLSLTIAILLAGCGPVASDRPSDGRLPVFAGVAPLAYLVEQIGGPYIKVDALVQPGQDPHTFEPKPQQVLALGRAAVFFKIDMPFENVLLQKVREGNPKLKVVDATQGIKKLSMDASCCPLDADHDHDHPEAEGEPDPHVWLSPPLAKILAENVAAALCQADPRHKTEYQQNLTVLVNRFDAVHQRIQRKLAPYRGRAFYVFHPGFAYFADAYQLRQEAVETGGRSPTPKELRTLIEKARADGVTTIFVQPQSAPQSAEVVANALGGKVVTIDGLRKDVIADIEDIAKKIDTALCRPNP